MINMLASIMLSAVTVGGLRLRPLSLTVLRLRPLIRETP